MTGPCPQLVVRGGTSRVVAAVRDVRLRRGGGMLRRPASDARRSWSERRGVLIEIELEGEDDAVGLGEASPLPGFGTDRPDDAARALDAAARSLRGTRLDLPRTQEVLDRIAAVVDRALDGAPAPSARMALETALLDAIGQRAGLPAAALVGPAPGAVEVSALLGDPAADGAIARAHRLIEAGALSLKLKLGAGPLEDELVAVRRLRDALGAGPRLLADANGAWDAPTARAAATALASLGVVAIEQPVAPHLLVGLGPLRLPVWADESLLDPSERDRVLSSRWLAGVALKPTALGGLAVCRDLGRRAAARGLGVAVTHALEGPVALAACAALAHALADVAPRAGLWPHAGLDAWPECAVGVPTPRSAPSRASGLGLALGDRARLRALPPWP
jgi:L-alanine-DL-glutamate epimerase-like enolase superfamily enzyme